MEASVLDQDNLKASDQSMFQEVLDEARNEILTMLKTGIKQTVLACLGFEKDIRGDGFRVDHCNGRMSKVTELVRVEVQDILKGVSADELTLTKKEKASRSAARRRRSKQRMWKYDSTD